MALITQRRLKELLNYDSVSGIFTWRVNKGSRARAGQIAGASDAYGYLVIRLDSVLYKAHRLAWLYCFGDWPEQNIDHINRVKSDNRLKNLRLADQSLNMHNANRKTTRSGIVGVIWDPRRRKWAARIKVSYKNKFLGRFDRKADAVRAREAALANILTTINALRGSE